MKKSNITGWRDVLSFTLVQTLKSRAYAVSYVILIILALFSMPLVSMFTTEKSVDTDAPNPISKVYIINHTSLPGIDLTGLKNNTAMKHITFQMLQESYDDASKRIEETEQSSVILTIAEEEGMFSLRFVKASDGPVKSQSLQLLGNAVVTEFNIFKNRALGITEEQLALMDAEVNTKVTMTDVNGDPVLKEDTSISSGEYWFIYGILFFVLMVNMIASTQIATSIVTEKSTRVVEYLLTSVKPLALMIGKIIAMLAAALVQMITMLIALFASNLISKNLSNSGGGILSRFLPKDIFQNINLVNIVLCLILVAMGLIFYAGLAGLAGATVSKLEEIQEGLTLFTLTSIVGAYIGLFAATSLQGGDNAFAIFAYLFPLSSPFVLPGAILIGKVSYPMVAVAIAAQALFILLLFSFVAKVFETLILHNGNTIKVKELLRLSKTL